MPVLFIEGPSGLGVDAKRKLVEKTIAAMVQAYQIPDDRVYINEYPIENVGHTGLTAQDGHHILEPELVRPVCTIVAPPDLPIDAKRKMMQEITAAVADVYHIRDLHNILIFLHELPIENAAWNGFLQSENPEFSVPGTAR